MKTRIRIGPFTFGKSGMRLSPWKEGNGFSIPLFNRESRSFGKVKLGIFLLLFWWKIQKGKTIKELSEIFGRLKGAIRARIDKILFEKQFQLDKNQ